MYDRTVPPKIELARSMSEVDREQWSSLLGPDGSPFLEWDWLAALEEAGCVRPETGWAPHHVTVRDRGRLIAAAPLYLKGHSQGSYNFV